MGLSKRVKISINHIRKLIRQDRFEFDNHGMDRATQRTVSIDQASHTIINGNLVAVYEDRQPDPWARFECVIGDRILVVIVIEARYFLTIHTVYWKGEPDDEEV